MLLSVRTDRSELDANKSILPLEINAGKLGLWDETQHAKLRIPLEYHFAPEANGIFLPERSYVPGPTLSMDTAIPSPPLIKWLLPLARLSPDMKRAFQKHGNPINFTPGQSYSDLHKIFDSEYFHQDVKKSLVEASPTLLNM